jgi:hypothetical protein
MLLMVNVFIDVMDEINLGSIIGSASISCTLILKESYQFFKGVVTFFLFIIVLKLLELL